MTISKSQHQNTILYASVTLCRTIVLCNKCSTVQFLLTNSTDVICQLFKVSQWFLCFILIRFSARCLLIIFSATNKYNCNLYFFPSRRILCCRTFAYYFMPNKLLLRRRVKQFPNQGSIFCSFRILLEHN